MDYLEAMLQEKEQLITKINRIEKEIKKASFPDGYLAIYKNGNSYKKYHVIEEDCHLTRRYLSANDKYLIQKLAMKAYKTRELYALKKQLKATESYVAKYPKKTAEQLLRNSDGFRRIILPLITPSNNELKAWEMAPNPGNPSFPEHLIYPTIKGIMVRSKSESLISDELFRASIPYRYEYPIRLGNTLISPDFMIMHPITKEIYIWEHFGRMDDPEYINNNFLKKMRIYPNEGYIPSINLICTYETSNHPLTIFEIDEVITKYFR